MDLNQPSSSSTSYVETNEEIAEINAITGINVWGQNQEVLEHQAFVELKEFNKKQTESEKNQDEKSAATATTTSRGKPVENVLEIDYYFQRQQQLKQYQEEKRLSQVSEKSRKAATKVTNRLKRKIKCEKQDRINDHLRKRNKCIKDSEPNGISDGNDGINDNDASGSEYFPSEEECEEEYKISARKQKRHNKLDNKVKDDGDINCFQERLDLYYKTLEEERKLVVGDEDSSNYEHQIRKGYKVSRKIWNSMYEYQKEGVKWLVSQHKKSAGSLLGDEMGLGKTVQVIAFLSSLNCSRNKSNRYLGLGPTLIVCPSTVIHQWVKHFHEWEPEFRVCVLHQSGTYLGNKLALIKEVNKCKGILITTYQSMLKYKGALVDLDWHYAILDEGHKIRNPDAQITVAAKQIRTPHRLMLTGSPMQNNLQELWSLFDFVNPGLLGTLEVFMEHFAIPIMQGGYANATHMQEALALSMAQALKEMITPHLLRRTKEEVRMEILLPGKSEQVLFCSLTDEQKDLYKGFLMSDQIGGILGRGSKNWFSENRTRANVLMAIMMLRKICNHPDIYLNDVDCFDEPVNDKDIDCMFGYYKRSGKMKVVAALLKIWKRQKHRTLLFTQGRAMIAVFEDFLQTNGYKYLKMDGLTTISTRQSIIDNFNLNSEYDVFLLTTRVGGLGINLTGADRVIIYDPDWNPATDTQARERAWRIGQDKEVTIYRLLTAGTIEEKMYQRQVWKQLLSNKILIDPRTQKFFKTSDLHDLFSLQEDNNTNPETANIFKNSRISIEKRLKKKKSKEDTSEKEEVKFSNDKIEKMKQLAAQISKQMTQNVRVEPQNVKLCEDQLELLESRKKKLAEREELKKLTPMELRKHNREKLNKIEEPANNKLDDCDTDIGFTNALVLSEEISELYKSARSHKTKVDLATNQYSLLKTKFSKEIDVVDSVDNKPNVDYSGEMDGEVIESLVRREEGRKILKHPKKESECIGVEKNGHDDYVLSKLFAKKGVHTALHHDAIVMGTSSESSSTVRIHSDTKHRTDLALSAIRKSNMNHWRW